MILSDHAPKASRLIVQNCRKSEVFIYHELSCKALLQPLNNRTIDGEFRRCEWRSGRKACQQAIEH